MNNRAAEIAHIMAAVTGAMRELSDEDLKALLASEGTLRYVPPGYSVQPVPRPTIQASPVPAAKGAARTKPQVDAAQVRAHLRTLSSADEAVAYLKGLGLSVAALKALANALDVRPTKPTGAAIVADIVKVFVTGRLITRAVRRF